MDNACAMKTRPPMSAPGSTKSRPAPVRADAGAKAQRDAGSA